MNKSSFTIDCELLSKAYEEEMQKYRQWLKDGRKHRFFAKNAPNIKCIELPENLLKGLEYVNAEGKKKYKIGFNINQIIQDAIVEYLISIHGNGILDPDFLYPGEELLEKPRELIHSLRKHFPKNASAKEIAKSLKDELPGELKHLSLKTIENYIYEALGSSKKKKTNFSKDAQI